MSEPKDYLVAWCEKHQCRRILWEGPPVSLVWEPEICRYRMIWTATDTVHICPERVNVPFEDPEYQKGYEERCSWPDWTWQVETDIEE